MVAAALAVAPVALVVDAQRPAHAVAARLGDGAHDAARRAAELRVVAGRLDLHFLDEVEHHVPAGRARPQVGGVHAVDDEPVLGT